VRIPGAVRNGDTGDVADDFYHKYPEDINTMVALGIKHFRMSLSWPRLLPQGLASKPN
jgi:beta-glucosidase